MQKLCSSGAEFPGTIVRVIYLCLLLDKARIIRYYCFYRYSVSPTTVDGGGGVDRVSKYATGY